MLMSVFLNKLVTFLTSGLWYVTIIHFLFSVLYLLFFCCDLFVPSFGYFFFVIDYVYGKR